MKLPDNHPLSNVGAGFVLKEAHPNGSLLASIDLNIEIDLSFDPAEVVPGMRPLKDVIPQTKGRALGWKLREHYFSAMTRKWPEVIPNEFQDGSIAICGGGPSLGKTLPELRALAKSGTKILAINRTHDFLVNLPTTHGIPWIKPWAGILLDPLPNVASYITPKSGTRYYVASQCAPETFDVFEKFDHRVWHCIAKDDINLCFTPTQLRVASPPCGSTCGLRAYLLALTMGFRDIHFFGFDSCYDDFAIRNAIFGADGAPRLHAYAKPETIHDFKSLRMMEMDKHGITTGNFKDYFGNGNMIAQADEFQMLLEWRETSLQQGHIPPHNFLVHGTGAIPDIAAFFGKHFNSERNVKHG